MIGTITQSGVKTIAFSPAFFGGYVNFVRPKGMCHFKGWTSPTQAWSFAFAPITFNVEVEVPEPPPVEQYPVPIFDRTLSYWPVSVKSTEVFSPSLVIKNSGKSGEFYIAFWYAGVFNEIMRGHIDEGATFTYLFGNTKITDLIGPVNSSINADLRFYAGYIKPGTTPSETYTDMLGAATWVEVVSPPKPPPDPDQPVSKSSLAPLAISIGVTVLGASLGAMLTKRT